MTPLIDCDILVYSISFSCERKMPDGSKVPISLEEVNNKVDEKIAEICAEVYATEPCKLFLTGRDNFRNKIAFTKGYKAQRKKEKPFHWKYIRAYVQAVHGAIEVNGLEADDLMGIEQTSRLKFKDTIICSIDKDLKTIPGMHYSWEQHLQPSFGPKWIDKFGEIYLKGTKIKGTGMCFFYSQMLTGDNTDNIPGLPRFGPMKVYAALGECKTIRELHDVVVSKYQEYYPDNWWDIFKEQATLLWMVRRLHDDGSPVMWEEEFNEPEYFN